MAGNNESEIVRRTSARDGAHRFRRSDTPGNLGVGNRLADGDLLERQLYALLERRTAQEVGL